MIILFSGKIEAGKDTVKNFIANKLIEEGKFVYQVNFADELKAMTIRAFDEIGHLTIADLGKQENKDIVLNCGITVREALQRIGAFWRSIDPDFWVNKWKMRVRVIQAVSEDAVIFATDCRYPNEVKAGHELNGKVIRLTRCPHPEDKHESETALDYLVNETEAWQAGYNKHVTCDPIKLHFDHIIDNAKLSIEQTNELGLEYIRKVI